jgi:hypothetical protein
MPIEVGPSESSCAKRSLSMRAKIAIFISLIIVFSHALGIRDSFSGQMAKRADGPGSSVWIRLLGAFENHSEQSQLFVYEIAGSKENSLNKELARDLLRNWDRIANKEKLEAGRVMHEESIFDILESIYNREIIEAFVFKMEAKVSSKGSVVGILFIGETPDKIRRAKAEISNRLKKYTYRPAFVKGKFVSMTIILTCLVEVHTP